MQDTSVMKEDLNMGEIETLWGNEIKSELGLLADREIGTEEYRITVDGITKLMDRKIELKKFEAECTQKDVTHNLNQLEYELKLRQLEADKRDRLIKNAISCVGIGLPLLVTIWGTIVSLNFEKEGVVTTGAGRGFINKLFHWK